MLHAAEPAELDASLITVNFRTIARAERLLASIAAAKPACAHETILVENGSSDPTPHLLRTRFPHVRYRQVENRGFSAGNNRGMEIARGRYFILLNPDTELDPGTIDAWIAWMDAHPWVGVSGPRLVYPDGAPQPSAYRYHRPLTPLLRRTRLGSTAWGRRHLERFERPFLAEHEDHAEVEWLLGAALCLRREVAYAVGGLDERFFLYFEDEDLCRRIRRAGHTVAFLPGLCVRHAYGRLSHAATWWEAVRKRAFREHVKSGIRYFFRYHVAPLLRSAT